MKIKIGQIEIIDPSIDELYALLDRYAGALELSGATVSALEEPGKTHSHNGNGNGHHQTGGSPADRVVLERLVRAGTSGVPTQDLGEILGRRGKSIRGGLLAWAGRIGLTQDEGMDPFDECRADGTRRGVRLKGSLLPVAEKLLNNR